MDSCSLLERAKKKKKAFGDAIPTSGSRSDVDGLSSRLLLSSAFNLAKRFGLLSCLFKRHFYLTLLGPAATRRCHFFFFFLVKIFLIQKQPIQSGRDKNKLVYGTLSLDCQTFVVVGCSPRRPWSYGPVERAKHWKAGQNSQSAPGPGSAGSGVPELKAKLW